MSLLRRRRFIDAIVISGGEPTLQPGLVEFAKRLREMGFRVKLDTNGTHPEVFGDLIKMDLIDLLSLDFKLPLRRYTELGLCSSPVLVRENLGLAALFPASIIRTTVVPGVHTDEVLEEMGREFSDCGIKNISYWVLQEFKPGTCLDPRFNDLREENVIGEGLKTLFKPDCRKQLVEEV